MGNSDSNSKAARNRAVKEIDLPKYEDYDAIKTRIKGNALRGNVDFSYQSKAVQIYICSTNTGILWFLFILKFDIENYLKT